MFFGIINLFMANSMKGKSHSIKECELASASCSKLSNSEKLFFQDPTGVSRVPLDSTNRYYCTLLTLPVLRFEEDAILKVESSY